MAARLCYCLAAGLSILANHVHALPGRGGGDNHTDVYDYIVVGSGPGGAPIASNLAKAGHSVLLLEAGDDQSADITTNILSLARPAFTNRWDFFVRHYSDDAKQLKNNHLTWQRADGSFWVGNGSAAPADANLLGVYYPRGATLGGSSVINAGVAVLPSRSDWEYIRELTGDGSWKCVLLRPMTMTKQANTATPVPTHSDASFGGSRTTTTLPPALPGTDSTATSIPSATTATSMSAAPAWSMSLNPWSPPSATTQPTRSPC